MIIDGNGSLREAASALLRAADIEAVCAADGEEALTWFARQWFPVLVANRDLPSIDGIEFVARARAAAVAPLYTIMLTDNSDSHEYERGYCAGVDHYLSSRNYQSELVARVGTGLFAIRRRQATSATHNDGPVIIDLESGAQTARHLVGRLHAEIALAARRGSPLTIMSACIEAADADHIPAGNFKAAADALLFAVQDAVSPGLHWLARLPASRNVHRLAIVMPESSETQVSAVEQVIRNTFVRSPTDDSHGAPQLSIGIATLAQASPDAAATPTALDFLGEAERNRRGHGLRSQSDLKHVQGGESDA
jgi:DNA-binding response OmpR family regulator